MPRHVKRDDVVVVTAGNDKGRTGKVLSIDTARDLVVIQGINVRKKNLKPTQQRPQGGVIEKEMPIHISNVSRCGVVDTQTCRDISLRPTLDPVEVSGLGSLIVA